MKRFISILFAVLLAMLAILPVTGASAASTKYYVSSTNGLGVRLRSTPSSANAGNVIETLGEATKVTVVSYVDSNWAEVKAEGRGYTGYVMRSFLSSTDPTTLAQTFKRVSSFRVTVTPTSNGGFVNYRTAPSKNAGLIYRMYAGQSLTVVAESRAWYQVTDGLGNTGYVVKAYVRK